MSGPVPAQRLVSKGFFPIARQVLAETAVVGPSGGGAYWSAGAS